MCYIIANTTIASVVGFGHELLRMWCGNNRSCKYRLRFVIVTFLMQIAQSNPK
jgi:hypothetical protein